jgi:hypothetical protein
MGLKLEGSKVLNTLHWILLNAKISIIEAFAIAIKSGQIGNWLFSLLFYIELLDFFVHRAK